MKVKDITYVKHTNLTDLEDNVRHMLSQGWCINGSLIKDKGFYIQTMFLPEKIKDLKTVVNGLTTESEFSKMFEEGYVLYGHPFVVDNKYCQSLVKGE